MISFNNNSYIQPIYSASKLNNNRRGKRSELLYITYRCPLCGITHVKLVSELYLLKGEYYCRECVDKLEK